MTYISLSIYTTSKGSTVSRAPSPYNLGKREFYSIWPRKKKKSFSRMLNAKEKKAKGARSVVDICSVKPPHHRAFFRKEASPFEPRTQNPRGGVDSAATWRREVVKLCRLIPTFASREGWRTAGLSVCLSGPFGMLPVQRHAPSGLSVRAAPSLFTQ